MNFDPSVFHYFRLPCPRHNGNSLYYTDACENGSVFHRASLRARAQVRILAIARFFFPSARIPRESRAPRARDTREEIVMTVRPRMNLRGRRGEVRGVGGRVERRVGERGSQSDWSIAICRRVNPGTCIEWRRSSLSPARIQI